MCVVYLLLKLKKRIYKRKTTLNQGVELFVLQVKQKKKNYFLLFQ